MSDAATGKSGKAWLYVIGGFALLPLFYLLSFGPAVVLVNRGVLPKPAHQALYTPLMWTIQYRSTAEPLVAYIDAWMNMTGTSYNR